MKRVVCILVAGIFFAVAPAVAVAATVFEVVVKHKSKETARGVATLVADEVLITSSALFSLGDEWGVDTGHDGRSLLPVSMLYRDEGSDIAVIKAPGLRGESVQFASTVPEVNRVVETLRRDKLHSRGVISQVTGTSGFEHSAIYPDTHHGSVVVNSCGQVVGLNRSEAFTERRVFRSDKTGLAPPKQPVQAVRLDRLKEVIDKVGVNISVASETCLSPRELAKAEQERVEAELAARRAEVDAAAEAARQAQQREQQQAGRAQEAERQLAEAQEGLVKAEEEARQKVEELEAEAARERAELERVARQRLEESEEKAAQLAQEQANKKVLYQVVIGLGIIAILIALLGGLAARRRSRALRAQRERTAEVEKKLDKATLMFPDIFLHGRFPEGGEARVKINGNALVRSASGKIVGRDPEVADVILNHSEVSRQHLKVQVVGGVFRVTDLGSFNGSFLNDRALLPHEPVEVRDGDSLRVGTTELRVVISA